jgi:hypothetical protein
MLVVAILALLVGFLAWRFPVAPPGVPPAPATVNSADTPAPVTSSPADSRTPSEARIGRTNVVTVGLLGRQPVDIAIGIEYVGDSGFLFDLFAGDEVGPGSTVTLEDGTTITYDTAYMTKGFDATQWISLALQIPGAVVSAAVVVGWLMKHGPSRERVKKTTIERTVVEFDEGEIRRVIEEKIEESENEG